jgi:hypothetical protein
MISDQEKSEVRRKVRAMAKDLLKPKENKEERYRRIEAAFFGETQSSSENENNLGKVKNQQDENKKIEKKVLWICPKCSAECFEISYCRKCYNFDFWNVVSDYGKRQVKLKYKEKIGSAIGVGVVLLIFLGMPIFSGAVWVFSGLHDEPILSEAVQPPTSPETKLPSSISIEDKQTKKSNEESNVEIKKAIDTFLTKNFYGFKIQGMSYLDCEEYNEPCDLQISKGKTEKVITVIVKEFHRANGTSYLFVNEARQVDLTNTKIEEIQESERKSTLENLTTEDINDDLKQAIYEELRDAYDEPPEYEPPDSP